MLQGEISATLQTSGLVELRFEGHGSGALTFRSSNGRERKMPLGKVGIYGFLFEARPGDRLTADVTGGVMELTRVTLEPATAAQREQYRLAEESFVNLGYYGIESQRPLPGVAAAPPVHLDAAALKRFAIRETALLLDFDYDFNWIKAPEKIRDFFRARGVRVLTAPETAAYLREKIAEGADGSSLVMAMGVTPDVLLQPGIRESVLTRYLRAGGRVVWGGDLPLAFHQDELSSVREVPGGGFNNELAPRCGALLGLVTDRRHWYGYPGPIESTPAARRWGLEKTYPLIRPVLNRGFRCVFSVSKTGEFAGTGMVGLKPENPLSGFAHLSGVLDGDDEAMLRDLWRLAWYSGKPVTVPPPGKR